jgi:hypothetical protein
LVDRQDRQTDRQTNRQQTDRQTTQTVRQTSTDRQGTAVYMHKCRQNEQTEPQTDKAVMYLLDRQRTQLYSTDSCMAAGDRQTDQETVVDSAGWTDRTDS